ncbi:hypothetical protein ACLKA6_015431 [Drosophila palustris]
MKPQTKYGVSATAASTILCEDVRNFTTRRRNLLYLMHRYLVENGYYNAAEALKGEGRLSEEFELCDNVDLDAIYLEYASFFNLKFGKYPRILKKTGPKEEQVEEVEEEEDRRQVHNPSRSRSRNLSSVLVMLSPVGMRVLELPQPLQLPVLPQTRSSNGRRLRCTLKKWKQPSRRQQIPD